MKSCAKLDYYIYNSNMYSTEDEKYFDKVVSPMIYEVIRVIDGVPLFLEQHIHRMRKSAKLLNAEIQKKDDGIIEDIHKLIQIHGKINQNIKLLCTNIQEKEQDFYIFFIESYYPLKGVYKKGIHTILCSSERKNPNAKVMNKSFRQKVQQALNKNSAFEALLVNHEGYITEGSRSNMFFIKEDTVYTAPQKDVLLGVTRNEIIKVCKAYDISVIEELIHKKDLNTIDGAFMSGTSVNVLPIHSIDENILNSSQNNTIQKISKGYVQSMRRYLESVR